MLRRCRARARARDDSRVELRYRAAAQLGRGRLRAHRAAVRTVGDHRVGSCRRRRGSEPRAGSVAGQAVGIAVAVPALVMTRGRAGARRRRRGSAEHLGPTSVAAHDRPLVGVSEPGLPRIRRDRDLADVMGERGVVDGLALAGSSPARRRSRWPGRRPPAHARPCRDRASPSPRPAPTGSWSAHPRARRRWRSGCRATPSWVARVRIRVASDSSKASVRTSSRLSTPQVAVRAQIGTDSSERGIGVGVADDVVGVKAGVGDQGGNRVRATRPLTPASTLLGDQEASSSEASGPALATMRRTPSGSRRWISTRYRSKVACSSSTTARISSSASGALAIVALRRSERASWCSR